MSPCKYGRKQRTPACVKESFGLIKASGVYRREAHFHTRKQLGRRSHVPWRKAGTHMVSGFPLGCQAGQQAVRSCDSAPHKVKCWLCRTAPEQAVVQRGASDVGFGVSGL